MWTVQRDAQLAVCDGDRADYSQRSTPGSTLRHEPVCIDCRQLAIQLSAAERATHGWFSDVPRGLHLQQVHGQCIRTAGIDKSVRSATEYCAVQLRCDA